MIEQARIDIWNGLKLYYGAIQDVVDATESIREGGYSRDYIYKVLSGKRNNIDILNLAADILEKRKREHHAKRLRLEQATQRVAAVG